MADPLDSAWALLYGSQQSCTVLMAGAHNVRSISSSTNISDGVIYPDCDLGNPAAYEASGRAAVSILLRSPIRPWL
ncbi:MAG: hypothetical protein WBP29_06755 [Candidatus Zixiibacteriota bacterium]